MSGKVRNGRPVDTFEQRLCFAVWEWGNAHQLSRILQERGIRGAQSIHSYMRGGGPPSVELIAAVADVTGVDPCWLAFGRHDEA